MTVNATDFGFDSLSKNRMDGVLMGTECLNIGLPGYPKGLPTVLCGIKVKMKNNILSTLKTFMLHSYSI